MTFLEVLEVTLPLLLYVAAITLLITLIVLCIKLIKTMNKVDRIIDDVDKKESNDVIVNNLLHDNDLKKADEINNNVNKPVDNNIKDFKETMNNLMNDNEENKEYCIYRVYVMNENDTLEYVLNKYQVTCEDLLPFNDLDKLQIGTKLIIPSIDE